MNLTDLQYAAADNLWVAIMPELMLGVLALALLALEMLLPKKNHDIIPVVSMAAQIGILTGLFVRFRTGLGIDTFNGLLHHSQPGQFMRLFFVLTSLLVSFLGTISLAKQKLPRIEFFHIVLVITAALMLLVQANHFILLFVALETVTIGFYILVSYFRTSPLSQEAGLKYLITGGLSSAILLFGITLLYGAAGNPALVGHARDPFSFPALAQFLALNPDNLLASVGIALVLCGVAFKIGAVPFQIWVPDVYQGAPTPVTAFLAVASKAAGFALLLLLAHTVFGAYQSLVVAILTLIAAATILFGNFAALTQHNVKRLMGLSGVAHAGYLLLGVVASFYEPMAISAVFFYLFAYLLASMAVFGVMVHLAGSNDVEQTLDDYHGLAKERPFLATVLVVGLGSLAGIPPLAGFIGKLLVFIAAFKAGLYPLLAVAVLGVVVSIYYYFGWIKSATFAIWRGTAETGEQPAPVTTAVTPVAATVLGLLALSSVVLGFYQGSFGEWLLPLAQ
ncbi:MAG: NADH-quinone oxidoreductase subunit N [Verrucomicrobia bacterium ADurb.Bin122]|nr:MAG: NADH-quinone oxidoreductase subunit N [Verrucomicrobia bacterium ADurb.Bin122]